jgi:hypothetical protein
VEAPGGKQARSSLIRAEEESWSWRSGSIRDGFAHKKEKAPEKLRLEEEARWRIARRGGAIRSSLRSSRLRIANAT